MKIAFQTAALWLLVWVLLDPLHAQTLNLPPRPANAPSGTEFINLITPLSSTDREYSDRIS